jgi:hypothetical protein
LRFQGGTKKAAYLVIFEGGSKLPHSKPPCGRKNYAALGVFSSAEMSRKEADGRRPGGAPRKHD